MASLAHQAFTYSNTGDFLSAMVPFIREGLEVEDAVLAVTSQANIAALRDELGADGAAVEFRDSLDWYRQPYQALTAYGRYVEQHATSGIVRIIGEPVWEGRSPASVREWTRYESALNVAFAAAPAWIVCPYSVNTLPEQIVAHALRTHPEVVDARGPRSSASYVEPATLFDSLANRAAPPPDAPVVTLHVEDLSDARHLAARWAQDAGLEHERLHDWTLAIGELITNGAKHGREPVRLRLWRDREGLVAEAHDNGNGLSDPLAGCIPTVSDSRSGRGLWIVRQLADSLDFCRHGDGFAVRMRFASAHRTTQA